MVFVLGVTIEICGDMGFMVGVSSKVVYLVDYFGLVKVVDDLKENDGKVSNLGIIGVVGKGDLERKYEGVTNKGGRVLVKMVDFMFKVERWGPKIEGKVKGDKI